MPTRMVKAFFSQEATEFGGQMGCMATMFQIFDRRRLLTGRRHGDCPGTMDELPPAAAGTSALLLFHYYFAICSQLKKPSILAYKKTKVQQVISRPTELYHYISDDGSISCRVPNKSSLKIYFMLNVVQGKNNDSLLGSTWTRTMITHGIVQAAGVHLHFTHIR